MANRSYGQDRSGQPAPAWQPVPTPLPLTQPEPEVPAQQADSGIPAFTEPEMRRWPHPVNGVSPTQQAVCEQSAEALLHYVRCALSYQNQLLADIKTLLEQMLAESPGEAEEK